MKKFRRLTMSYSSLLMIIPFVISLQMRPVRCSGQEPDRRIDLRLKDASLPESLENIQQLGKIHFFIRERSMEHESKRITMDLRQVTIQDALKKVLEDTHLEYKIVNGFIVIDSRLAPVPPAAKGTVEGNIEDSRTKEELGGATIIINGKSYLTDAAGHFKITLPPGSYDLYIRHVGYSTKFIQGVKIAERQTVTLAVFLEISSQALNEVIVAVRKRTNTEIAMLEERKNSSVIQDAISARNIEKTASITTTQALQRIAGVTITDDKYVAIRGMGDRNVVAQLNGARLSAANSDRNAVPLDLVPASLLDNITIYKTITPDKPADAPAGIVELKTKSIPDVLTINFSAQAGANSGPGLNGNYTSFYYSDPGLLGQNINKKNLSPEFINLTNQYPDGIPQLQKILFNSRESPAQGAEADRINRLMHQFDPVLTTSSKKATPNQIYNLSFGNSYKIFHQHSFGIILGASYYHRTEDRHNARLSQYSIYQGYPGASLTVPSYITPDNINLARSVNYTENTGTETLNYGFLSALTYRFNPRNEVSVHYIINKGAEVEGSSLLGAFTNTGLQHLVTDSSYTLRQTFRTFNTLQFRGEHKLWTTKYAPKFSWNFSGSHATQNDPDFRYVNLIADSNAYYPRGFYNNSNSVVDHTFYTFLKGGVNGIVAGTLYSVDPNGRRYRKLTENNRNYTADLAIPFHLLGQQQEFKIGGYYLKKDRVYNENILSLPGDADGHEPDLFYAGGDLNRMIAGDKIGLGLPNTPYDGQPRSVGFLYNFKKSYVNYSGFEEVFANYAQLDLHLFSVLHLAGGVRFESTTIKGNVDTVGGLDANIPPNTQSQTYILPPAHYVTGLKPFPSANLTWRVQEKMNIRLAYSSALTRPELRELVPVVEFDPFQFALVAGNSTLVNQRSESYDFRWEWFTGPGEVISASVFGKTIHDQLSKVFLNDSLGSTTTTYQFNKIQFINDKETGHVYGIELELRKNLSFLGGPFRHFFIGSNLLLAHSEIKKNGDRLRAERSIDRTAPAISPLFEQPPFSVNANLDYDNPHTGTSITANFNMVGERLILIHLTGEPDVYDQPAPLLDFVLSQKIGKRWLVKGFAKNVLNPAFKQVYTNAGENGKFYGREYPYRIYHKGAEYSLGITYNMF